MYFRLCVRLYFALSESTPFAGPFPPIISPDETHSMRKTFTALTLALLTLLALPLAASELPADAAPAVQAEIAEDVQPDTAAFDLESVLDDGRVAMTCNFFECYQSCLAQYGEGVYAYCVGERWNSTCVCYP